MSLIAVGIELSIQSFYSTVNLHVTICASSLPPISDVGLVGDDTWSLQMTLCSAESEIVLILLSVANKFT